MMGTFAGGDSNVVYDIVTGPKSWIYCNDPETKRQSAQCVLPFEELLTKVNRGRNVGHPPAPAAARARGHTGALPACPSISGRAGVR
ncbi:hypothetical protein EVAR_41634_1 [Eumeta japonica]|uniref:Uncharacterized protein n=1 Tax=Eumeta variegata TaxID=151549 RepID=A0A4C1X3R0_EUMVA|nr:hypothetical protein EVAR_41634_1 [Eumeta japonica]